MTTSEVAEVQKRFNAWADEQIGACEETPAHTPDRQLQLDTKIDTLRSAKLNLATFMALNLFCTIEGQCNARWAGRRCNLPLGHSTDHGTRFPGIEGLVLAPWPRLPKIEAAKEKDNV